MTLLTFVKNQVAVDPGKLHKFIEVLCRRPPMAEVVARLEGTYRKFLDGGVLWWLAIALYCKTSRSIRKPS